MRDVGGGLCGRRDGRVLDEVCDRDGFVAIWTLAASADPAGEGAAGVAALLAQLSFTAVGAFVDGVYRGGVWRPRTATRGAGLLVASPERGLRCCCGSGLSAGRGEAAAADRAGGRPVVVPRRGPVACSGRVGVGHGRRPSVGGVFGLAHAIRLAVGDHDGGVVQQPVQDADGGGVFGQEPAPLFERPVGADGQRPSFVGCGDEAEQQLGAGVVQRREPDLINYHQIVAQQGVDDPADGVVGQAPVQRLDQIGGGEVAAPGARR